MSLLAVQTDAAINSGNSGGPVLNKAGHCIGIAFQSLTGDTQSIGYVIPTSVVRHFLEDVVRNGRYTGFPSLNIGWQELDSSAALKRAYKLDPHQKGILVRSVAQETGEAKVLQVDDVILKIGGVEVGADGSVPFRHGERVDFKHLITQRFVGDVVNLDILRAGEQATVSVELQEFRHLIPPHNRERKPSYLLVGGLVFTACSDPYLVQRYGSLSNAPVRLMAKTFYGIKDRLDHQTVVLSNVLACSATMGYDSTPGIRDSAVKAFNGEAVWSLVGLAKAVRATKEPFLRFDMEAGSKVIIMDAEVARECTDQVGVRVMHVCIDGRMWFCMARVDDVAPGVRRS
jgi:PDZ domain